MLGLSVKMSTCIALPRANPEILVFLAEKQKYFEIGKRL